MDTVDSRPSEGHFAATLAAKLTVSEPGWLAAHTHCDTEKRVWRRSVRSYFTGLRDDAGRRPGKEADIRFLLGQVQSARSEILAKARFDVDSQHRDAILELYDRAVLELETKLGKSEERR